MGSTICPSKRVTVLDEELISVSALTMSGQCIRSFSTTEGTSETELRADCRQVIERSLAAPTLQPSSFHKLHLRTPILKCPTSHFDYQKVSLISTDKTAVCRIKG